MAGDAAPDGRFGMKKRAFSVILALALILQLTSCGGKSFYEALEDTVRGETEKTGSDAGDDSYEGWFADDVWRADVDYRDMEYESYDLSRLEEYTAPIYELAESGGETEDFNAADDALYDQIAYIYTLYVLKSNEYYADSANEELAAESARAMQVYYDAQDEYLLAMRALASSENRDLMTDYYPDAAIDYFAGFEPSSDEEDGLTARETELTQKYYALMAEEEPDWDAVGEVFVELVELRRQIADILGYDSYAEYAYESFYMKDYSPESAETVWRGAKEYFAPLVWAKAGEITDRAAKLAEDESFECNVRAVLEALEKGSSALDGEVYVAYKYLKEYHLYDLEKSSGKADEGFTTYLQYYCEPFIFNAATNTFYDFPDTFHEFGHFVSYFYSGAGLIFSTPDNDLSELHAQGMNVVMTYLYDELFDPERADVIRDTVLMELALSVVDGALYDEFQQRVYSEPDLTPERVNEIYAELYEAYGYAPYEGYEREWMSVVHNFTSPFYYISYAVSALGALEINELCQENFETGRDKYLELLAMDPEVWYYSEALTQAGLSDIFDIDSYAAVAEALERALDDGPEAAAA